MAKSAMRSSTAWTRGTVKKFALWNPADLGYLATYAAAALMNPSAVPHFDQSGMPPGSLRILMSMRSVGEGHISSVAFREGIITSDNELKLAPEPPFATAA